MAATRRKKSKPKPAAHLLGYAGVSLIGLMAVLWLIGGGSLPVGCGGPGSHMDFADYIVELSLQRGAAEKDIVPDQPIRKQDGVFVRTWEISVPSAEVQEALAGDLVTAAIEHRGNVGAVEPSGKPGSRLRLDFGQEAFDILLVVKAREVVAYPTATPVVRATPTRRPEPPHGARGKLAILLDDGGQSMDLVASAAALPKEVSVAILPFLPHSSETAVQMHTAGHEVWLHLPMEPEGYPADKPGPGAILVAMDDSEIRTTVHSALNNVPHVVGVNNHMGSRATANLRTMTWVMQELKSRGVAFIDSRTTVRTVAEDAARSQGVATGRRHVFLDNERSAPAVRRQLAEAVYRCRMEGEAIAIGHLTKITVQVLAEDLPTLADRGADLVAPSKAVR